MGPLGQNGATAMGLAENRSAAADGSYPDRGSAEEKAVRGLWIAVAGSAGAVSRYQLEGLVSRHARGAFQWGTLAVNVSGCFALGLLFTLLTERFLPHPDLRAALTIGFLGAYTTFSRFAFETLRLAEDGARGIAVLNVVASVASGVVAAWLGVVAGRTL